MDAVAVVDLGWWGDIIDSLVAMVVIAPSAANASGPLSSTMMAGGASVIGATSSCEGDPTVGAPDAGGGSTPIDAYGTATHRIPISTVQTGMQGLAVLYPSVLVIDINYTSWGTHLKALSGEELPTPATSYELLAGGADALQPRPGNMPGLYLLQVGEVFYQYGGPLETGASPQTTAVYADYDIVPGDPNQVPGFTTTTKYVYTNNLSGAQLWRYVTGSSEYVEVRHVDGSVAHFESFNPYVATYSPSPTRNLWRITWVRDPYDNQSDYTYNSLHQLTEIAFPSGIQECFNYLPSWRTGWPSGSDCIEISYKVHGSTPTEAAAKTWAMVFTGTAGTAGGNYFGKRLYRTYSAPRDMLVAASSGQPYGGDAQSVANGQIVHEFQFDDGTRTVTEVQKIHDGSLFAASLSTPAGLSDLPFLRTASGSNGRVVERTKVQEGETLTFSYPSSGFRTTDLLSGTQMSAIESTNGTGTVRRYEFDYRSGRLYSVFITPSDNSTGHPRASHATGENAAIGGVATTDVEPEHIEIYNIYDTTCVCKKPVERRLRSTRGGVTVSRVSNFTYDPLTHLLLSRKEPNPEAGSGTYPAQIEWTYTYTQAKGTSQDWGAWLPATETTPDGSYTYTYIDWLARTDSVGHGMVPRTMTRSITGIRRQDSLNGAVSTSSTPVTQTVWRNLSNLPGSLPKMGNVNGQVRKTIDGDGVETVFEFATDGFVTAQIFGGDIKTTHASDAMGQVTSVTSNDGSSVPAVTTVGLVASIGVPAEVSSTSGGLTRHAVGLYDRWGHLSVVRRNNLASNGSKPNEYPQSGNTARDWIELQAVYHHTKLMEVYEDRLPLNAAAGTGQFLVTSYNYGADGRLASVVHPNGSTTTYTFDGYGTLYRSVTTDPTGLQSVNSPKTFVNPFLEVTGSYEYDGTAHLWTLVTRNAAGAIIEIQEPATVAPAGYTGSTGGATHTFEVDMLGRPTVSKTWSDATKTTLLESREMRHDQLGRQIWQRDHVLGFGSGTRDVAWTYVDGKASQLLSMVSTGVAATTYEYYSATGFLQEVRDGFSTGNTATYYYQNKTPFLASVVRTDLDPVSTSGTRVTTTDYAVDPFGRFLTVTQQGDSTTVPSNQVYSYAYNSLGLVDSYTGPGGRVQKFLPDALGRVVQHVRVGVGNDYIDNRASFEDSGASDGRTKVTRKDGLGNETITHNDFAGRPFIVQNPGGSEVPSSSAKYKPMCLFAEYDGASRLSALYDGDLGKTLFWRDGQGRMIQRQLDGYTGDVIALFNTKDVIKRDAIGRIVENGYWGAANNGVPQGLEQFDTDSLGRVHQARFLSAFAPSHTLTVSTTFSDGNPYRETLSYGGSLSLEGADMSFGHDAIGRLTEVQWNKAPGASGAARVLAQYSWAGGLRRQRTVRYGSTDYPQGVSTFSFDPLGRLTMIRDNVYTDATTWTTKSQFEYAYDEASNLTKEIYTKVGGAVGDRFAYDAYDRLTQGWMGVDATTMANAANPTGFDASHMHEELTYGLDDANNRYSSSTQTGSSPAVTDYTIEAGTNRYDKVTVPGATTDPILTYDKRGNLTYDGRLVYKYDFLNRLQEVWRVLPAGDPAQDGEKFAEIQPGSLDQAREDVKVDIPDIYSRLAREHTDPVLRARLRATISGGVVRITPTPGGGGRSFSLPVTGELELVAVYVYDAFNRRTMSALVDPQFSETQIHAWDGWRQVSQHKLELVNGSWQATPTKQFVWGSTLDELVAYRRLNGSSWESYYLLHGGQDTAAKLVNSSGVVVEQYEYDPYGRVSVYVGSSTTPVASSAYGLPFLWKSIRLDEITGLLQMRNRYYSTELGRFLTRDPLGVWADTLNGGNEYAYCSDSPVGNSDALGEWGFLSALAGAALGGLVAAVTGGDVWAGIAGGAVAGFVGNFVGAATSGLAGGVIAGAAGGAAGGVAYVTVESVNTRDGLPTLPEVIRGGAIGMVWGAAFGLSMGLWGRGLAELRSPPPPGVVGAAPEVAPVPAPRGPTTGGPSGPSAPAPSAPSTRRPSWRRPVVRRMWDEAPQGQTPGSRRCSTCDADCVVRPFTPGTPRDWHIDHFPTKWYQRDLSGLSRRQIIDLYHTDIRLRCIRCNVRDNK